MIDPYRAKHLLKGLDELSRDNLYCNRITSHALLFALQAVQKQWPRAHYDCSQERGIPSTYMMFLAEQPNDMIEASKALREEDEKQ